MHDLSVSVVIYKNRKEEFKRMLESVLSSKLNIKLYVVDNSPTPDIKELCDDSRIEYIFNNKNLGYGAAHNISMTRSIADSKYHLVLNPDVYFEFGVLEQLYDFMEKNANIGLVMPKVLYEDGSTQFLCKLLPTPMDLFIRRFVMLKKFIDKKNNTYELRFTKYNTTMNVPSLSGCFMFLRTKALKDVGCFDERYFMYLEDVDLCRRIHTKYNTMFYPKVAVYHGYHKGSYKNFRLLKYHIISAIKYFNKWGWFFDSERSKINEKMLLDAGYCK